MRFAARSKPPWTWGDWIARLRHRATPREALDKLGLRVEDRILRAAVVAFGKQMLPHYPQCGLRLARFRGTTKTEFIDQRQLNGHAFQLLQEADFFLRRHLPVAGRIQPGVFEREDLPIFPPMALREALVNALCHRDYSIAGGAVSVAIFDDRLEITSTGTLPVGITVADLKREHTSKPRNPLIAEVFYRRGLIERWEISDRHMFPLSQAFEGLLPRLGEKKNDGGQFFTPREIIRVIVRAVNPQLGGTVYDPCCGTGGFLIEAFKHLMDQHPTPTQVELLSGWVPHGFALLDCRSGEPECGVLLASRAPRRARWDNGSV
jgi:hypothetical protein